MAEKEYIERNGLLEWAREFYPEEKVFASAVINAPTADVQEVRRGSWKPVYEDWRKQIVGDECSACGFQYYGTNIRNYNYCPGCGAKMDKE